MLTLEKARAFYSPDDPVHDFSHIERVYALAERIAPAEGADLEIVRMAVLLHDARGSESGSDARHSHEIESAIFAGEVLQQERWPAGRIEAVQHCIRAHRFRSREKPATIEAQVLFDADKLDVLGAIGVARVIGYAALSGQPFYAEPSEQFLQTGHEALGEPHSAYHEHLFKLRRIKDRLYTPTARAIAEERFRYIDEYFLRLAAEIRGEI